VINGFFIRKKYEKTQAPPPPDRPMSTILNYTSLPITEGRLNVLSSYDYTTIFDETLFEQIFVAAQPGGWGCLGC